MTGIDQLKAELDTSKSNDKVEYYKISNILLAAFLLIQDNIILDDILANDFDKKGVQRHQCIFMIKNTSGKPLKNWILEYHSDQVMVLPNKYNKKISDLRDLINQRFS